MDNELQDRAWAALPKEFRNEVRELYFKWSFKPNEPFSSRPVLDLMERLFGRDNATSDTEYDNPNLSNPSNIGKENPFKVGDFVRFKEGKEVYTVKKVNGLNIEIDGGTLFGFSFFEKIPKPKFKLMDKVSIIVERNKEREVIGIEYDDGRFWYFLSGKHIQVAETQIEYYKPATDSHSLSDAELDGIIEKLTKIRDNRRATNKELLETIVKLSQ